jgi:type I restriction enzyme, S subunit
MDWIASEVRNTVAPELLGSDMVFHYSIPVLDETGDGADEAVSELGSSKTVLAGGEVLISKLNPRKARVLIAEPHDVPTICSGEFVVLRPEAVDSRYLYWLLLSETTRQELHSHVQSVTRSQQRARPADISKMWIEVPPRRDQQAIADYLNAETKQIDAVLVDAARLARLAEERVWGRFCEMVTSTGAAKAPLRRVLRSITDGPFGSAFKSSDYSDEGAFVVRLGNIGLAEFHEEPAARIPMTLYDSFLRHQVRPGNLLIAGLGDEGRHAGRACVAPDLGPAMVKGKCFCAQIDERLADPRYLALYLSSSLGAQEVALVAHGSGRVMINLEIAKALPVILPALSRQTAIVEETEAEQERANRVGAVLGRQVELLVERRQAMVTAAVTGQLDITDVAG